MSIDELGRAAASDLTQTTSKSVRSDYMLAQLRNERARRTKLVWVVSAAVAVMILVVGGFAAGHLPDNDPSPAPADSYPDNGKIIVVGSNYSLYEVEPDGWGVQKFQSSRSGMERIDEYTWSPDGSRLAFLFGVPSGQFSRGDMSLYVINADGSAMRRLARCPDHATCDFNGGAGISWSPDATKIALTADGSLFVVDVDSATETQVPVGEAFAHEPAWSPDGTHIAFIQEGKLFVVSPDGSALTKLASVPKMEGLDWSPDGAHIAVSALDGVYVLDADGANLQHFVTQESYEGPAAASWSADSTRIAYFNTPKQASGYAAEIWSLDPQSGNTTRLYHSGCCVTGWGGPEWSPDGRYIAFSLNSGLFTMNSDGTNVTPQLAYGPIDEPEWQPIP